MKLKKRYLYIILLFALVIAFCRKAYIPEITSSGVGVVVIEGHISGSADSTYIYVSKTVNLSGKVSRVTDATAIVSVEDDQNNSFPLTMTAISGKYGCAPIALAESRKYRARVKVADGSVYVSDFTPVKNSPAVDSVGHNIIADGLQLYVNTHDDAAKTRYYRWDFEETWRFHSYYNSAFMSDGKQIVSRPADKQIYYCFAGAVSSTVIVQSSTKLTQDVVYQQPLTLVPKESEKVEIRYSILVKQYGLTETEYAFWQNLKTNTQNLGSIFDAQPSSAPGNIHCTTDAGKQVIGFIGAGNVSRKRVFIDRSELPNWSTNYPYECKDLDSAYFRNPKTGNNDVLIKLITEPVKSVPTLPISSSAGILVGYYCEPIECVDCRLRGQTPPPLFWK